MTNVLRVVCHLFIGLALACAATISSADDKYPSKPIEIVVPLVPGGGTDLLARITANYLSKKWGVPVNVTNKPGGQTIPAQLEVYSAANDGYTILADGFSTASVVETGAKDLPFKVLDRTFIAETFATPMLFVVGAGSSFKTLGDAIAAAKRDPQKFTWTSFGGISIPDFHMRRFFKANGIDIMKTKPVMGRGGPETATLLAGNHAMFGSNTSASIAPLYSGGMLRPLAISGDARLPTMPALPTLRELGYTDLDASDWKGFSGPPGLPKVVVETWEKALAEMLKDPAIIEQAAKLGAVPQFRSSVDMRAHVVSEIDIAKRLWEEK